MSKGTLFFPWMKQNKWGKEQFMAVIAALPYDAEIEFTDDPANEAQLMVKVTSSTYPVATVQEANCWVIKEATTAYRAEIVPILNTLH